MRIENPFHLHTNTGTLRANLSTTLVNPDSYFWIQLENSTVRR
jgi:hypothetical protein